MGTRSAGANERWGRHFRRRLRKPLAQRTHGGDVEQNRFRQFASNQLLQFQLKIKRKNGVATLLKEIIIDRDVAALEVLSPKPEQLCMPSVIRSHPTPPAPAL